ncbi:PGF-CTERM sorting domain-containing protein [Natrarchaeobius halalkaliphilus]|uniref:PGF-CTERM sorting domain-containing protein n=1 Tax=Natrarchaeobius halalkaliphilus TaxID=1679091 RepID=A0A3N6LM77_9EURY|nr:BGTF surface domain-containing protein [Natrarchaeobius halalkaliphilus]RQG88877.1 PGF-CTERM sorting domain-containing protein [Natrarchaeobius halalkaliphilus]
MSTRNTTSYREKGRAVFLAAIMVISVVAMSAAFAGAATATDDDLDSGSTYWQGQELHLNLTGADDPDNEYQVRSYDSSDDDVGGLQDEFSTDEDDNYTYETDGLDAGDYVVTNAGDNSVVEFDNGVVHDPDANASDAYFEITTQDLDVEFDDDEVNDGDSSTTDLDIDSNRGSYSVIVGADGDLDDEELFNIFVNNDSVGSDTLDDIDNADHADDLYDEIRDESVSNASTINDDHEPTDSGYEHYGFGAFNASLYDDSEDDYEELIVLSDISDREEEVNFQDIDADEYDFDFEIVDTTAEDSATINVVEEDVDGSFDQSVYTQTAGDVVEFTVELEDTDEAWIQIGDEDAGFVDIVHVEDDDDNDEATFQVNTRTLGTNTSDIDRVYHSEDDEIQSEFFEDDTGAVFWDEEVDNYDGPGDIDEYADYLEELDLINDADDHHTESGEDYQLTRPLQATDYDVAANGNAHFIVDDDGESELDDELDLATLDLTTPGVDSISTWVAPGDDADEDDELDEVLDIVTERTDVAEEDRLVIKAEATGLYGAMVDHDDNDWDALDDGFQASTLDELTNNDGEGINFEVEADDATGNQDATQLDLDGADDEDIFILADQDAGEFVVIVDTSSSDAFDSSIEDGMDFTAELEYETDSDDRYEFADLQEPFDGGANGDAAYPYFNADSTQSVSTEFTIVEPEATFENLDEDDNVQLETSDEFEVTGETNIAPGSDASVRITNAGDTPSFLHTLDDTEIDSDGSFATEAVDLSDRDEGDEGEVDFRVGGSTVDDVDALFVDELETDDEPEETDDTEEETDDTEEETDDSDDEPVETDDSDDEPVETDDSDDEPVDSDDSVPGFGVAVALVALLAAAMLALRRQH